MELIKEIRKKSYTIKDKDMMAHLVIDIEDLEEILKDYRVIPEKFMKELLLIDR